MIKPLYRVPSMEEIAAIPHNGYSAISTFSGCGGSSLGYKMAGFKVLWASEFIPAAQETYRANHFGTILDTRDIRLVQADDILEAIGMQRGQLDLFDGSPPCASFSTAGKREDGWGKIKQYSDTKQRVDDLFFEYARLIRGVQPKVFVAENVSGLVKGTAKGYFLEILAALKECGYNVKAQLLDAKWLGVPQSRQRIIFMGVRNDFAVDPVFPKPLPYNYTVREALPWIVSIQYGDPNHHINPGTNFERGVIEDAAEHPARTVKQSNGGISGGKHTVESEIDVRRYATRVIHDTSGQYSLGDVTDRPSPTVDTNPRLFVEMEADISRYAIGRECVPLEPGAKSDKYLSLDRPSLDSPSPTVTQRGGDASAASVTHPTERRKFSIAELKRICAFPDDFVLTGSYAQQWERLGRAVPPVMMSHVARVIRDEVLPRCVES